jgi:imidazolonepropionase-like amidohydrolase
MVSMEKKSVIHALVFVALLPITAVDAAPAAQVTPLVVTHARLVDGRGGLPLDDATIVIQGDRFSAVGPSGKVSIPEGAEVLDAKGRVVIPGLIDAHIHVSWPQAPLDPPVPNRSQAAFRAADLLRRCLLNGITTVRDLASIEDVGIAAKRAFQEGRLEGSRPIVCGQGVSSTGGHGTESNTQGLVMEVDGPDGFRRGVRTQLKAGADLIKVLCPFSREEILAAVEEAHLHEKFVTVHFSLFKAQYDFMRWTVEAGADCFEHAYAIPDDIIPRIAEKRMYCVPTLSILLILGDQYEKKGPDWAWKVKKYRECKEIFQKLRRAGVRMAVGTDAVAENMSEYPGLFFKETDQFAALGCSPMEVIVAATRIGAEVSDAADQLGTIEPGKLADLLILDKDPLVDIRNLRTAQVIVQGGKVIKR